MVTPSNPPSPYEQLLLLVTPSFKMFLERSLNDPSPPHFKHPSLLPPPLPKILIIHIFLAFFLKKEHSLSILEGIFCRFRRKLYQGANFVTLYFLTSKRLMSGLPCRGTCWQLCTSTSLSRLFGFVYANYAKYVKSWNYTVWKNFFSF